MVEMLRETEGGEHLERGCGLTLLELPAETQRLFPLIKPKLSLGEEFLKRTASFWRDSEKVRGPLFSWWSLIASNIRRV